MDTGPGKRFTSDLAPALRALIGRSAFTLLELLVVIGIIGVLFAFLLPALTKAREAAVNVTCASQLRQLSTACQMYLNEHRSYPESLFIASLNTSAPSTISPRLINQLAPYLHGKLVDGAESISGLPRMAVCPVRAQTDLFLEANNSVPGFTYWLTGYIYCGCVDEPAGQNGRVMIASEIAGARGRTRGVLWADTLIYTTAGGAPVGYSYFHYSGGAVFDPAFGTLNTYRALTCQHRAWSDGSVEQVEGSEINLDPAYADTAAAYVSNIPGGIQLHYYF